MTKVFVEELLALPGSSNKLKGINMSLPCLLLPWQQLCEWQKKALIVITLKLGESKYWAFRKEECTDPKGLLKTNERNPGKKNLFF